MKKILVTLTTLLLLSISAFAQDGFDGIFEPVNQESAGTVKIEFSGEAGFDAQFFFDAETNSQVMPFFFSDLTLSIKENLAQALITISVLEDFQGTPLTADDLLDTASLRGYLPFGYLEMGLLKTEWGKGDGIHAVDPLNPLDQSQGIKTDLNDMKISVPMIKLVWSITGNSSLELVYEPFFTPMKLASVGRWVLGDFSLLPPPGSVPNTQTLEYSSAAARLKGSFGSFDLGVSYYNGFYSQPGFSISMVTDIVYTRAQLLGLEAGFVAGPFTFMAEGGYWLSEDADGTDPSLYNNKIVYLGGVDFTIPSTEAFISLQLNGSFIMDYNAALPIDVDTMAAIDNQAFSNTLIAALDWPFANETLKIRIVGLYLFEAQGYLIIPSATWKMTDNLELTAKGQIYGGADIVGSPYFQWDGNDNASLEMKYVF